MNTIALSTDLVNNILQYLGNRPYVEVANLIAGIQQEATAAKNLSVPVEEIVSEPTQP